MTIIAKKLKQDCPLDYIPYKDSNSIDRKLSLRGLQERAFLALEQTLEIDNKAFNIYLSGDDNLDRSLFLHSYLNQYKSNKTLPCDLIYIHNFDDHDRPILIKLPAGLAISFKTSLAKILELAKIEIISQLQSDTYIKAKQDLKSIFNIKKNELLQSLTDFALKYSVFIEFNESLDYSLSPIVKNKKLSIEEIEALNVDELNKFNKLREIIKEKVENTLLVLAKEKLELNKANIQLEKNIIEIILSKTLTPYKDKFLKFYAKEAKISKKLLKENKEYNLLSAFLDHINNDILENYDIFSPKGQNSLNLEVNHQCQDIEIIRHDINIFVDNSNLKSIPIIWEENPSLHKIFGYIDRENEMGVMSTDFSLIRAGSLHKALGGILILYIHDLIQNSNLWEVFLRVLNNRDLSIQEITEQHEGIKTKSIEPDSIQLDTKIILIGSEEIYESLFINDERFRNLFKVKAQMLDYISFNKKNTTLFLSYIATIIDKNKLLNFNKEALAYLVEYASSLAEDYKYLSLQFKQIQELMLEANSKANIDKKKVIDKKTLEDTYNSICYRKNSIEECYLEEIKHNLLRISTNGFEIGKINALSIVSYADYDFGLPHQISSSVGVGLDGLISLEREVEQSGSIHSKAILIIKAFLNTHFAQKKALTFNASLYFEQSYTGVEGDSASLAELLCLLSSLSNLPINMSIACTGAINQAGDVLSVGGVSTKIEAFYKTCKAKRTIKNHGVVVPYDNKDNIFLSNEIIEAHKKGIFKIYLVKNIQEAINIYFNMQVGNLRKDGTYTENSFYNLVDSRLKELGYFAQSGYKKK